MSYERTERGGYIPPEITYGTLLNEKIRQCQDTITLKISGDMAFSYACEAYDLCKPFFTKRDKELMERIYVPEWGDLRNISDEESSSEEKKETVLERIERKYMKEMLEEYENEKGDKDQSRNRALQDSLYEEYTDRMNFEKARVLVSALVQTEGCKSITREGETWTGTVGSSGD